VLGSIWISDIAYRSQVSMSVK